VANKQESIRPYVWENEVGEISVANVQYEPPDYIVSRESRTRAIGGLGVPEWSWISY